MEVINAKEFEEKVLKSDKPVVVDFFATWCGPCKMLAPVLEDLNNALNGAVGVYKIDIDDEANMPLIMEHQIQAVPTMLFIKNGKVEKKIVGLANKIDIGNAVKEMLL